MPPVLENCEGEEKVSTVKGRAQWCVICTVSIFENYIQHHFCPLDLRRFFKDWIKVNLHLLFVKIQLLFDGMCQTALSTLKYTICSWSAWEPFTFLRWKCTNKMPSHQSTHTMGMIFLLLSMKNDRIDHGLHWGEWWGNRDRQSVSVKAITWQDCGANCFVQSFVHMWLNKRKKCNNISLVKWATCRKSWRW